MSLALANLITCMQLHTLLKNLICVDIFRVGEKVKPLTKGKVSAYAGPVEKIFSPMHVCLSFTNRHDITEKVIADKVGRCLKSVYFACNNCCIIHSISKCTFQISLHRVQQNRCKF